MSAPLAPSPPHPPAGGPTGGPASAPRPDRGPLVQRLLLGAGALCVLVAGAVYLAVSWDRIGTGGQAGIALVVTVLVGLAAHVLTRRALRASAETFALVASGLLALDLAGVHHLDVAGAGRLPWWTWLTGAGVVVLVVTAALAVLDRLVTYRVVAVAAAAALPLTGLAALAEAGVDVSPGVATLVALGVAAAFAALAWGTSHRDPATAAAGSLAAGGWWLGAIGTVPVAVASGTADIVTAGLAWGVVATTALLSAGRAIATGRTTDDRRLVVSVVGPLAALPATLVVALAVHAIGPVAELVAAALVAALAAFPWSVRPQGLPSAAGASLTGLSVLGLSLLRLASTGGHAGDTAAGVALLLAAAGVAIGVHARATLRTLALTAAVAAAFTGLGLLAVDRYDGALWVAAGWTGLAVGLLMAAALVRTRQELLLSGAAVIGGAALVVGLARQVLEPTSPALAVALLGLGAGTVGYSSIRASRFGLVVGATGIALAAIDLAVIARVDAIEAYTLPVAGVLLLAGIVYRVGAPERSSWEWTAPAIVTAAVPSVTVALTDTGVTRLVLTATVAAAVVVAGARFRLAAPLLLGAVAEAVLAVSQLAPYAVGAPRWITLALAGVLLLTLGVLFERARRGAAVAGRWYAELH